jgi:hypothetical protein
LVAQRVRGSGSHRRTDDPGGAGFGASQVTYSLAGVEIAATSTQGTFVGVATSPDDFGTWQAVVVHEPLDDNVLVTGGVFAVDGQVRNLEGLISDGNIEDWLAPAARRRST